MKVFATYNSDESIRRQSSSGGVFTILAENTLRDGGVVYGAAFDDEWNVTHRRVDSIDGLSALRGSKYVYSKLGTAIKEALADLNAGRKVLFSGTPCQAAAMRKLGGEHPDLTIVEVVCHGAPEPSYWSRYLSELCAKRGKTLSDISSINFRDKRTGWGNYSFTIRFSDGRVFTQLHDDNLYMQAFLKDFTLREACFRCHFKYPNGCESDVTIGDLWGSSQLAPEIDDDKGISLIISQTPKGDSVVSSILLRKEIAFDEAAKYNPAITTPAAPPVNRGLFVQDSKNENLHTILNRFAGRTLLQTIYIRLARLKHRLIHI